MMEAHSTLSSHEFNTFFLLKPPLFFPTPCTTIPCKSINTTASQNLLINFNNLISESFIQSEHWSFENMVIPRDQSCYGLYDQPPAYYMTEVQSSSIQVKSNVSFSPTCSQCGPISPLQFMCPPEAYILKLTVSSGAITKGHKITFTDLYLE